jgi:mevalonate kinase
MIPAKILLFGEHIIIKGAQALVIPFPHFGGEWKYAKENGNNEEKQMNLAQFAGFLTEQDLPILFDIPRFHKDLSEGLYFDSNIPTGYGLGSSGSVTAAVYERYVIERGEQKLSFLKTLFAQMESFFHGMSSGIDPLICSVQQPIWLESKEKMQTITCQPLQEASLFLLDTKVSRSTSPFVNIFLKNWEVPEYAIFLKDNLFPENNNAIQQYARGEGQKLFQTIHKISKIQTDYFSEMIPSNFKKVWKQGLESNDFRLKLCGAGGGGFILGITQDFKKTKTILSGYNLIKL